MNEFTGHTGEQTLALVLQLVARLDHLGLKGEVRVRILTSGGPITLEAKSAAMVAEELARS